MGERLRDLSGTSIVTRPRATGRATPPSATRATIARTPPPPPASVELTVSADPSFHGDAKRLNPEQLVVVAASSCQLLSFLAIAARARVQVLEYDDRAEAEMPEDDEPLRLTRITLRPHIVVGPGVREERVLKLAEMAHEYCYIANSLTTEVIVEPEVEVRAAETTN